MRDRGWPVVQTALAAGLAYFLAKLLLGHPQPFFAAVAAVVTLGAAVGWAVNRAIQVILGVAVGLVIADLLVLFVIGTGPIQLVVVLALAMGAVVFFGGARCCSRRSRSPRSSWSPWRLRRRASRSTASSTR